MRRIPPYIGTDGDLRSGGVHGEDARHDRRAQAARHLFYPLLGGGIAKRGGGLASTTPRFHPFLNAPTRLMETCGQVTCSVWTLPIRFTVGTGGTIRGQKRHNPGGIDFGGVRK